jgi:hypothetical protein
MNPIILFRRLSESWEQPELESAKKYFEVSETRIGLQNRVVIPRYSAYPFYRELERDVKLQGSELINSTHEWYFVANFNYYIHVKDFTPKTYFSLQDVPKDESMQFVVKGRTKSKKEDWNTRMFANGYTQAAEITCELMKDNEIFRQGVIVREFVPLKVLEEGINGLPFSNEWRFFYYKNQRLTNFYYWQISDKFGTIDQAGLEFADKIANILSEYCTFFVIDIAEKATGGWTLIEMNDGGSSGVAEDHADELYSNLSKKLLI